MLSLEVRKKTGEGEVRRVAAPSLTVGASSGNHVVVRARGVAGRHFRIIEKDGSYFLDVFKGVEPVYLNGREVTAGPIGIGDRVSFGEASITLLNGRPTGRLTPHETAEQAFLSRPTPVAGTPPIAAPALSETDFRGLRLEAYRLLKRGPDPEAVAQGLLRFLADEIGPGEWALAWIEPGQGLLPIASSFRGEAFPISGRLLEQCRSAVGPVRADAGNLPLIVVAAPARSSDRRLLLAARETLRLPPRTAAFLEELVQMADLALSATVPPGGGVTSAPAVPAVGERLIAASDAMRRLLLDLPRLARSRAPVLISGDVGTGKDAFALALHRESGRASGPFVVFDCAASARPDEELFGRVVSGARGERRRSGRIEEASGGTLVVNEVGALPAETQARFLQVILRSEIVPVGSETETPVHVRWVATTSQSLLRLLESNQFRRELYFRLAVLSVRLPALAEQREAIPALVEHFVRIHAPEGLGPFEPEAMDALLRYRYPGNIRELENEIIRLAAICQPGEPITADRLDPRFRQEELGVVLSEVDDLKRIVESVERQVIDRVMRKVEGNQSLGAELLNISRGSLIAKIKEYSIRDYRYLRREKKK